MSHDIIETPSRSVTETAGNYEFSHRRDNMIRDQD